MKRFLRSLPFIVLFFGFFLVFPKQLTAKQLTANAVLMHLDFGDFSGDSDFGGGGGWDSGGSDWGDSDWGDSDSDWSSSGSSDVSYDGGGAGFLLISMLVLIIFIYFVVASTNRKFKGGSSSTPPVNNTPSVHRIDEYNNIDPNFNAEKFRDKVSNLYVQFQHAWQKKDLSPLRPYLTDTYYAQMDNQLNAYRCNHQTNIIDRIAVLKTDLISWKQEGGLDIMTVRLETRIVDYVIDDNTGTLVRGNKSAEKFMTYEWTLVRTTGVVTSRSSGTTGQTCPYCGAKVNINQSAVCDYCQSVLTTDSFDWAVSNIKAISQRTRY